MKEQKKDIDRRKFLELTVQGSIGLSLTSLPLATIGSCESAKVKKVHGACYHDCPDRCSWTVTVENGQIMDFQASTSNPFTAGQLCNKMVDFPADVTFHPDRILTPLKRMGKKGEGNFIPISWDEAISEVASKLNSIIASEGGEAVLPFSFGGNQGMVHGNAISSRFFAHIGASQLERTICGNTAVAGLLATNGQTTGVLPEDIIHSRFIIIWGSNPVVSNQHLWLLMEKAKVRGAKIVVVDPYKSQTARKADWHIQIQPGTDTVLALGIIRVIIDENLHDEDYIEKYTTGIEQLTEHIQQYTPEIVSAITGISEEDIIQLAREYSQGSPSLIRLLIGMEHQANGASAFRSIAMLPAITGAWRQFGGGLMNMTYELFGASLNWTKFDLPPSLSKQNTRSINMIQLGKALKDSNLMPPVHALFVYNANPVVTVPHQNLVIQGLEREDLLTVVLEHFVTDTARYADYIFPATTVLENWDILDSWGSTYLNINEPAIEPLGESRSNSEFFRTLARAMGFQEDYLYESDLNIIKDVFNSDHPYMKGISFDYLRKNGWASLNLPEKWMPHAEGNFDTPSGKCQFYNPNVDPPLPEYIPVAYAAEELNNYPFQLLTIKSTDHFLNSSHANVTHLLEKEGIPLLDIHKVDADAKGIKNGDQVKVYNDRGEWVLTARIGNKVNIGVVSVPQGFWPSLLEGGSSANALTTDLLTDMGRGGAFQETRVDLRKV